MAHGIGDFGGWGGGGDGAQHLRQGLSSCRVSAISFKKEELYEGHVVSRVRGCQNRVGEAPGCSAAPHLGETLAWHNCSITKPGGRPGPEEARRLINS